MGNFAEQWSAESRPRFAVRIDDQTFGLTSSAPTGGELLALVERDPIDFFLVLLVPGEPDVVLELNEPLDLSKPGTEELVLVSRSRRFAIQIDETTHTVVGPFITGRQILELEGKDPKANFVTQILRGVDDIVVDPDDRVDLSKPGVERFTIVVKPCEPHHRRIDIDGQLYDWNKDTITTEELITLGNISPGDGMIVIDAENNERTLAPGETVTLTDGVCFGRKVRFRRG